jgi:hypothetical protein
LKDLRVVTAKVALTVTSVSPIRGFLPPSVMVLGDRLNLATEILYNQVVVDEYIIQSPNRIVARIPPSQVGYPLTDFSVLCPVPLAKQDALVTLGIRKPIKTVEGIDRLVQNWILVFLSTPGSDIFNPTSGGGAMSMIGKNDQTVDGGITANMATAVMATKSQILKAQATNSRIPPSERLLSCSLVTVKFNRATTTLSAVVDIKNVLGGSAVVNVG